MVGESSPHALGWAGARVRARVSGDCRAGKCLILLVFPHLTASPIPC